MKIILTNGISAISEKNPEYPAFETIRQIGIIGRINITTTINQCQILKTPIIFSFVRGLLPLNHNSNKQLALSLPWSDTTDDMDVQMIHLLPAIRPGVDQGLIATGQAIVSIDLHTTALLIRQFWC